jgi:undecaprenyl-diphosphatase
MLAAGIAGFFAVRFMLKLFAKIGLKYFSYYLFALGAAVLIVKLAIK